MTSQDVSVLYPQFMYESILKVATDDPEFSFKTKSTPYPTIKNAKNQTQGYETTFIAFILSISYSLMLSIFVQ